MRVRDLIRRLQVADPEAVVLYLAPYADVSEAEEIHAVCLTDAAWICERHVSSGGSIVDVHHPADHGLSIGWNDSTDTQHEENVVVLSTVAIDPM
jgi:hypothetical protein